MIITVSVVTGFQREIRDKVIGFGSHIQVLNFDNNDSWEQSPVDINADFISALKKINGVRHVQMFATKPGILKANGEIEGIVVKGVGNDFDWSFFQKNLVQGQIIPKNDTLGSIIISKYIASKLKLKLNDKLVVHFAQNNTSRPRVFHVGGIYETGLGEQFDQMFAFTDISVIQKLNRWQSNQAGGLEALIDDFSKLDFITEKVNEEIGYDLSARNIKELNSQVFSWLDAQDINAVVVIVLMILVAGINMITALLILILERTNMIGILKALGSSNISIRKIFLYNAAFLISRGLLWGNLIAIAFMLVQKQFGIITLNPESYYLSFVPVNINVMHIILLNIGTLVMCTLMLIIPSLIITRINPVKAIRFS